MGDGKCWSHSSAQKDGLQGRRDRHRRLPFPIPPPLQECDAIQNLSVDGHQLQVRPPPFRGWLWTRRCPGCSSSERKRVTRRSSSSQFLVSELPRRSSKPAVTRPPISKKFSRSTNCVHQISKIPSQNLTCLAPATLSPHDPRIPCVCICPVCTSPGVKGREDIYEVIFCDICLWRKKIFV